MDVLQGAAGELASRLGAYSERCLAAAEQLAHAADKLALPRMLLLQAAVEYQLKSYLVTARGGAPDTRDLARLGGLARLCGLVLSAEDLRVVDQLAVAAAVGRSLDTGVGRLCRHIHDQQG